MPREIDKKEACPQSQTDLVTEKDNNRKNNQPQAKKNSRSPCATVSYESEDGITRQALSGNLAKTAYAIHNNSAYGLSHLEAAKSYDLIHFDKHIYYLRKLGLPIYGEWQERKNRNNETKRFMKYFMPSGFKFLNFIGV